MKTPKASALQQNPWSAKFDVKKLPKRVKLDKAFAGIKAGGWLYVGTPQLIDAYLRGVPAGETRAIERMRRELARKNQCDATCPVSTAIFCASAQRRRLSALPPARRLNTLTPARRLNTLPPARRSAN
jgi:hypothetical protein